MPALSKYGASDLQYYSLGTIISIYGLRLELFTVSGLDIALRGFKAAIKTPNDVIDVNILGRDFRPFDGEPWIQCTFPDCSKWIKDKELRNKDIPKYHLG